MDGLPLSRSRTVVLTFCAILSTLAGSLACDRAMAPQPSSSARLVGRWKGALDGRAPCVGDWSSVVLTLTTAGTGEIVTADNQHFPAADTLTNSVHIVEVTLPSGPGECQTLELEVSTIEPAASGMAQGFSGTALGRCCGTIMTTFSFSS